MLKVTDLVPKLHLLHDNPPGMQFVMDLVPPTNNQSFRLNVRVNLLFYIFLFYTLLINLYFFWECSSSPTMLHQEHQPYQILNPNQTQT